MNSTIANGIVAVANCADINLEIYEAYSGRGMYGKKTVGITGDWCDLLAAVAIYAADLSAAESIGDGGNDNDDVSVDDLSLELKGLKYDNMGLQMVFY